MNQFFTIDVLTVTIASGIALATPFLLAALGETIGQRSGVINLGVDGIMLLAAFATYFVALKTENLLLAVLAGAGTGAIMGVVTALVSVTLKAEQGISGIVVVLVVSLEYLRRRARARTITLAGPRAARPPRPPHSTSLPIADGRGGE